MEYIKSEIKKTMSFKSILFVISIVGISSYIMSLYEPDYMGKYFKIILSNISLIYLITIASGIVSEDFETGTYKQIYTGRFLKKEIIGIKTLIIIGIGVFFAFVVFLFPFLSDLILYKKINYNYIDFYNLLLAYSLSSFAIGSFSIFFGYIVKRFDLTLLLTFVLHFGILAQIIHMISNNTYGIINHFMSFIYFTIVPLAFTTGEITLKQSVILSFSGMLFTILSIVYVSKKDIYN